MKHLNQDALKPMLGMHNEQLKNFPYRQWDPKAFIVPAGLRGSLYRPSLRPLRLGGEQSYFFDTNITRP